MGLEVFGNMHCYLHDLVDAFRKKGKKESEKEHRSHAW